MELGVPIESKRFTTSAITTVNTKELCGSFFCEKQFSPKASFFEVAKGGLQCLVIYLCYRAYIDGHLFLVCLNNFVLKTKNTFGTWRG